MLKSILTAFLIGSSWLIFIVFFRAVYQYKQHNAFRPNNCIPRLFQMEPYDWYTQTAPLYFGLMSILAILIHTFFGISVTTSYILMFIISVISISTAITFCQLYRFTPDRLIWQYFFILVYHFVAFNMMAFFYNIIR